MYSSFLLYFYFFFYIEFIDPKIKEDVQNYLDQNNQHFSSGDSETSPSLSHSKYSSTSPNLSSPLQHHNNSKLTTKSRIPTIVRSPVHIPIKHSTKNETKLPRSSQIPKANGSDNSNSHSNSTNDELSPKKKCGFEAYMMTGDLILNLSRTQQTSGITQNTKKVRFTDFVVVFFFFLFKHFYYIIIFFIEIRSTV